MKFRESFSFASKSQSVPKQAKIWWGVCQRTSSDGKETQRGDSKEETTNKSSNHSRSRSDWTRLCPEHSSVFGDIFQPWNGMFWIIHSEFCINQLIACIVTVHKLNVESRERWAYLLIFGNILIDWWWFSLSAGSEMSSKCWAWNTLWKYLRSSGTLTKVH